MDVHAHEEAAPAAHTNQGYVLGLALTGGIGLILMILALGIGVVQGEAADVTVMNIAFVGGLLLLILGIGGWLALVKPFNHFDDIDEPLYTGHHDHDDEPADALAIIPHE